MPCYEIYTSPNKEVFEFDENDVASAKDSLENIKEKNSLN